MHKTCSQDIYKTAEKVPLVETEDIMGDIQIWHLTFNFICGKPFLHVFLLKKYLFFGTIILIPRMKPNSDQ